MELYSGLFYGHHHTDFLTFKKALLLYDELHFLDRPSFGLGDVGVSFHTIGAPSPYRDFIQDLNRAGFKLICHEPLIHGPIKEHDVMIASVSEDMKDRKFVQTFIRAFLNYKGFSDLFLSPDGKYPVSGKHDDKIDEGPTGSDIKRALSKVNWSSIEFDFNSLSHAIEKEKPIIFNMDSRENLKFTMQWFICEASFILNASLLSTIEINSVPFTSIQPYHELLLVKYNRAKTSNILQLPQTTKISYIADTIFDEIIHPQNLEGRSVLDILKFKERHVDEIKSFRYYLRELQTYIESQPFNPKMETDIQKIIDTKINPLVKKHRDDLKTSWEDLFGNIINGVFKNELKYYSFMVAAGLSFDLLPMIGIAGGIIADWTAVPVKNFIIKRRRIHRDNSLSYLLRI